MKRTRNLIGNIYEVRVNSEFKRYFQFIARDRTLLGSDVIRVFEPPIAIDESPDLNALVRGKADIFLHVFLRVGVKLGVWKKVGHSNEIGDLNVCFRDTDDYALGIEAGKRRVSETWWVWKVNEGPIYVGKLTGEYRDCHPGIVLPPDGVLEILKGHRFPPTYPSFE